ncbi:MAG: dTDP-glucose 4,6-dehydratase [Dehalococcoidia bacterium]|nr:dTDP-glucose 4,6-dehydratase [Dehalococcoidia bacterium]
MKNLLVTGGAGFIGSNFARHMLYKYEDYRVVVFDKLTYAGNTDNVKDLAGHGRFAFVRGDICDVEAVDRVMREQAIDTIVNFAAETHVDRSLIEPGSFIMTDVFGTYVLLEAAKRFGVERYLQVSTDEVYGEVNAGSSRECDIVSPRSPYAASKAGGDLMVRAYFVSFGLPVVITRGSNNYGPYQYPEKFIPLFITNAIDDLPLPIYGDGKQVRDWIYVLDHCEGIDTVLHRGEVGEVYNVGGGNERYNLDVAEMILTSLDKPRSLFQHVTDRPGHDRRYCIDCDKLGDLGWTPRHDFDTAMEETIRWYVRNEWWWRKIKSGEFMQYYRRNYDHRSVIGQGE